jgi:hypothetical protein
MLNPSWDASQWCYMRKLKKNHWLGEELDFQQFWQTSINFFKNLARSFANYFVPNIHHRYGRIQQHSKVCSHVHEVNHLQVLAFDN